MRLNQFLAAVGLGSRRAVEDLILARRVCVNRQPADLQTRVAPGIDDVTVDGRPVHLPAAKQYVILHKPSGVTVTRRDRFAVRTVYDLLPPEYRRLAYVGRLDRDSEGLLLFSDDGALIQRLLRPEFGVPKEYQVETGTHVDEAILDQIERGVEIEPGVVARVVTARFRPRRYGGILTLVLAEGKKREVRRLCRALGIPVGRLLRTRFGPLVLGDLPPGGSRPLTSGEIKALRAVAGVKK